MGWPDGVLLTLQMNKFWKRNISNFTVYFPLPLLLFEWFSLAVSGAKPKLRRELARKTHFARQNPGFVHVAHETNSQSIESASMTRQHCSCLLHSKAVPIKIIVLIITAVQLKLNRSNIRKRCPKFNSDCFQNLQTNCTNKIQSSNEIQRVLRTPTVSKARFHAHLLTCVRDKGVVVSFPICSRESSLSARVESVLAHPIKGIFPIVERRWTLSQSWKPKV